MGDLLFALAQLMCAAACLFLTIAISDEFGSGVLGTIGGLLGLAAGLVVGCSAIWDLFLLVVGAIQLAMAGGGM